MLRHAGALNGGGSAGQTLLVATNRLFGCFYGAGGFRSEIIATAIIWVSHAPITGVSSLVYHGPLILEVGIYDSSRTSIGVGLSKYSFNLQGKSFPSDSSWNGQSQLKGILNNSSLYIHYYFSSI